MINISRHYRDDHIKADNVETHVAIYEDQIRGWFFDQARTLEKASDHAGFVILLVVLSYVEGHAIFYNGEDSKNRSKEFFRQSFKRIFPLSGNPQFIDAAVDEIYDQMRNGLFHAGITRGKVTLADHFANPVQIIIDDQTQSILKIEVSPTKMLSTIEDHLSRYLMSLRDNNEIELRENFERAWRLR